MVELVHALQVLAGLFWLPPALLLAPAFFKVWRGTAEAVDVIACPIFFNALVQIGFSTRWLIWPPAPSHYAQAELAWWASCYLLSCIAALGVGLAHQYVERLR